MCQAQGAGHRASVGAGNIQARPHAGTDILQGKPPLGHAGSCHWVAPAMRSTSSSLSGSSDSAPQAGQVLAHSLAELARHLTERHPIVAVRPAHQPHHRHQGVCCRAVEAGADGRQGALNHLREGAGGAVEGVGGRGWDQTPRHLGQRGGPGGGSALGPGASTTSSSPMHYTEAAAAAGVGGRSAGVQAVLHATWQRQRCCLPCA